MPDTMSGTGEIFISGADLSFLVSKKWSVILPLSIVYLLEILGWFKNKKMEKIGHSSFHMD